MATTTFMQDIWQTLYDANADVVLVGHNHNYERFAPMNANGVLDRARGIREFVVGTGGANFTGFHRSKPNSEVRQNNTYGVLKMTLHPASYDWRSSPKRERLSATRAHRPVTERHAGARNRRTSHRTRDRASRSA